MTPDYARGLKPCPFCGEAICFTWVGNSADSLEPMEGPMCKCGAQGPMYPTREQAVKAWNTRSDAAGFRDGIEAAAEYVDSDYPVLADHIRQLTPAAPELSEEAVRRVAIAISGAPFPSKRSMEKARAALAAMGRV